MEESEIIELKREELENLPDMFRKIYYNKLTSIREEVKRLKKMSPQFFETVASHDFSKREISKTINHSIFSQNEE